MKHESPISQEDCRTYILYGGIQRYIPGNFDLQIEDLSIDTFPVLNTLSWYTSHPHLRRSALHSPWQRGLQPHAEILSAVFVLDAMHFVFVAYGILFWTCDACYSIYWDSSSFCFFFRFIWSESQVIKKFVPLFIWSSVAWLLRALLSSIRLLGAFLQQSEQGYYKLAFCHFTLGSIFWSVKSGMTNVPYWFNPKACLTLHVT